MAKRIYKYQLSLREVLKIELPIGAKVLHFNNQYEIPTLWVEVDTDEQNETRKFLIVGTGHDIPANTEVTYIGSALFEGGKFVWHLYEECHLL